MDIYEKNRKCIKEFKTNMENKLSEENWAKPVILDNIISVDSRENSKVIVIQYQGTNYRLNSIYKPSEEARKWSNQYEFLNHNIIISMFGFGNGVFVRALLNKINEGDTLLIYEPCAEIFLHALENYDLSDILENSQVSITVEGINSHEFHDILRGKVNVTNLKTQKLVIHPQYEEIFPYQYRDFLSELRDNNNHTIVNVNTSIHLGENIINSTLKNLKYIINSNTLWDFCDDFPKDVPAIIISAGPSLRKNIEQLKQAEGRAVIFVVDRALDFVLDHNITPDFVVTIDLNKPLEYFTTRKGITIPLLTVLEGSTEIYNYHKGKKIIGDCNEFIGGIYGKLGKKIPELNTGVSVATATFFACWELNFRQIILVGQDLAYDGELTHISGNTEEGGLAIKDVMVDGIYGEQVKTRFDWYRMLTWYQDMLHSCPEIEVIDATEGGALIQGSVVMSLKEAIIHCCKTDIDCRKIVEQKPPTFSMDEIDKFVSHLQEGEIELKSIKKESSEAVKICSRILKSLKRGELTDEMEAREIARLSEINASVSGKAVNSLIDKYVTVHTAKDMYEIYQYTAEVEKNKINTYNKAKRVYEVTADAVNFAEPLLEEAIEELKKFLNNNFCNDKIEVVFR